MADEAGYDAYDGMRDLTYDNSNQPEPVLRTGADDRRTYSRDDRSRSRSPARENGRDERNDYRDRSASPDRRDRDRDDDVRDRRDPRDDRDRPSQAPSADDENDEGSKNPGTNLFITGLVSSLSDEALRRMFEKYGDVEECKVMRDPHSQESRGFGFVKLSTVETAEAAVAGLNKTEVEGKTVYVEKAKRAMGRKSTPGRYHGPRKEGRRGYGGGRRYGGDNYGSRYRDYRDDRGSYRDDRGYGRRDDYRPSRHGDDGGYDRYSSNRGGDDRSYGGREDRGSGYGYGYSSGGGRGGYDERDKY